MSSIINKIHRAILKKFSPGYHVVPDIYGRSSRKLIDIRSDEKFLTLSNLVIGHRKSYLYYDRLFTIYQALNNILRQFADRERLSIMEVGVFRGGGSYFIASVVDGKSDQNPEIFSVDTFCGHSDQDILANGLDGDHAPGSFTDTSYESVREYLDDFPFVKVLKGRVQNVSNELPSYFHFIHLDVDIYEPTRYVLETYFPKMPLGGGIIVDDYGYRSCPGVQKAVDEFVNSRQDIVSYSFPTGQCLLVKVG